MLKPDKVTEVDEILDNLNSAKIAILTEFQGMTVAELNELRKLFRNADMSYKVYKNTLVKIAAQKIGVDGLEKYLTGTTAVAFSKANDLVAPAKIVKDFGARHQKFKVKGGILEKKAIDSNSVIVLANLPPKEVLIARVLGGIQAPISRMLSVLQGPIRNLMGVLKSIEEQKRKTEANVDNSSEVEPKPSPESGPVVGQEDSQVNNADNNAPQQTGENPDNQVNQ